MRDNQEGVSPVPPLPLSQAVRPPINVECGLNFLRKGEDTIMEAFSTAIGLQLYWVQPKTFERQFELRTEDGLFGGLRFETALGTLATASSATGRWTFKRVGFLNPRVTIREAGANDDLAVYWPKLWGDGWLEFVKGSKFLWKATNFWGTEWGFSNVQEELLFVLKPGVEKPKLSDLLKTQAVVEIGPQGHGQAELPLLLMLGWYLMILHQEDTTVTVTTTTAAVC
jgi:hypothetical protein